MTFKSLPFEARPIKATEAVLERLYEAARSGLKDNSLALEAGLLPIELRRLQEFDPFVNHIIDAGRAALEKEMAGTLIGAARQGDWKAALEVLKHKLDWVAKQQVNISVAGQISVLDALAAAEQRLTIANNEDVTDLEPRMIPTKEKTA